MTQTSSSPKTKVAVLGGGIGSLSAIYELTALPENREKYDITVYQLGWRLGGKGASGRNLTHANRIEEHGLHVWFGCYDNAFRQMKDAYHDLGRPAGTPLATFEEAFRPHDDVVFMEQYKDRWVPWSMKFPTNAQKAGEGDVLPSFWSIIQFTVGWMSEGFESLVREQRDLFTSVQTAPTLSGDDWWGGVSIAFKTAESKVRGAAVLHARDMLKAAKRVADDLAPVGQEIEGWFKRTAPSQDDARTTAIKTLAGNLFSVPVKLLEKPSQAVLCWLLNRYREWLWTVLEHRLDNDAARQFWVMVDTAVTWIVGVLRDEVLQKGFFSIDQYDFREWMLRHGAKPEPTVNSGLPVRGIYDAAFAYENGDEHTPNFAAGTALLGVLRIMFTYKGHIMYKMQAGMGDVVVTPMYEVLRERGVKFKFFHNVRSLGLSPDQTCIDRIDVLPQVILSVDDYEPQVTIKNLLCWPSEPLWWQLEDGAALQAAGVDFEHVATVIPGQQPIQLQRGRDFDLVILGIPIKAVEGISRELYDNPKTPQWKAMIDHVKTVQTQAYQTWFNQDLEGLGWIDGKTKPVLGTYVELLDTYADMTHLIPRESWPTGLGVKNIAYFCGAQPDTDTQEEADALAYQAAYHHTVNNMPLLWQNLKGADGQVDWGLFVDPKHGEGEARFRAQFFRANWTPTERYTLSVKGSTQYRLKTDASGYSNLYLCGDWIDNDFNSGCIEATVMSGMQCSRAICGYPSKIVGENPARWLSGK